MWISARWSASRLCRDVCSSRQTGRCQRRQGWATEKQRRLCVLFPWWAAWCTCRRTDVGASLSQPLPGIKAAPTTETSPYPGFRVAARSLQLHRRVGNTEVTLVADRAHTWLKQALLFFCINEDLLGQLVWFSIVMNTEVNRLHEGFSNVAHNLLTFCS